MAVTFLVLKVGCLEIPLYVFERTGIKLLLRGNPSTLIDGFHSSHVMLDLAGNELILLFVNEVGPQ